MITQKPRVLRVTFQARVSPDIPLMIEKIRLLKALPTPEGAFEWIVREQYGQLFEVKE